MINFLIAQLIDRFSETIFIRATKSFNGEILLTVNDYYLKDALYFEDLYLKVGAHIIEEIYLIVD